MRDDGSAEEEDSQGAGKMLFVAAIRGTQAVWRSPVVVTIVLPVGSKRIFPHVLTSTAAVCFSHDANKDKSLKCVSQASLAQRLCSGAERGSINQLSLYTSPSLPNITLGLPATATATAASNVRSKLKLLAD